MWRNKKRRDDGDFIEDRKNPKKAPTPDDSDSMVVCEISKSRRVSVRNWQGKVVVDIREFYAKDGLEFPGKKGISLSMDQWNMLRNHVEEIDKAVAKT